MSGKLAIPVACHRVQWTAWGDQAGRMGMGWWDDCVGEHRLAPIDSRLVFPSQAERGSILTRRMILPPDMICCGGSARLYDGT